LLTGAIEGFYGRPWTHAERLDLYDWMGAWGLNTYLYAPKDDLHHRALWREPYGDEGTARLRLLIQACAARGISFVYGVSPGLDIDYSRDEEVNHLLDRCEQLLALGCDDFALLFDDIPANPDPLRGSLAAAQCRVANAMLTWLRARRPGARFLFCPTAYCGRMVAAGLGGEDYLPTIGRELRSDIDVFWTGPDIVSAAISVAHVREVASVLRRPPVIWDNLYANDYDSRRFFCGPYSGRPLDLRAEVRGLLANPNSEFPLNYVPLLTLSRFVRADAWNARQEYLAAMRDWAPAFAPVRAPLSFDDLILLGDCYYLPHEDGPEAESLYDAARQMLDDHGAEHAGVFRNAAGRLRSTCDALTEIRDRPLFHALSRRIWELREALDQTERAASARRAAGAATLDSRSGGIVGRLERLRWQHRPAAPPDAEP
jgi:protein O-GlcNAcase/histone acetyltransferase